MKKVFQVKNEYINSRLDRWFRRNICEVPQSLIEKNIRKGKIKVNNIKQKSSYKLKENDQISLFNINHLENKHKIKTNKYIASKKDLSESSRLIIEDNENFVVINKPSGVAVQSGTKSRRNILDILKHTEEFYGSKPYAVHRIDKETTGILIVAKNRKYAQLFTSLFRIRKIHKIYIGLVLGEMKNKSGTLKDELTYYDGNKMYKSIAITDYVVLDSNNNYSLVELHPKTGRKHQLRKQLLIHGNPILGDSKYRFSQSKIGKKSTLMLHAYKIYFSISEKKYNFTAELPSNFNQTIKEKYLKISE